MPHSPTTARREFGNRLRKRRMEQHLTAAKVADFLELSRVYYSKIENAHAVLADARLPDLIELLDFNETDAHELTDLLNAARPGGWWEREGSGLPELFIEFIGLEQGASRARIFESRLVTGLAQTRAYASAVVAAGPDVRQEERWRVVDLRMHRQDRLQGPDPLEIDLIICEAVLMQQFDGPEILRDQLLELLSMIDASMMRVRVQPFTETPLGLVGSSTVVLLDFSSRHLPTVAWVEGGGQLYTLTDDEALVQSLVVNYEFARTSSLNESDSRGMIEARIADLENE